MTRTAESARLESLSKNRAELLQLLVERNSRESGCIAPWPRDAGPGPVELPVSAAQQRLWFIDQLEDGTAAYNSSIALTLRGAVNREALHKALAALVQRHEILRTVFVDAGGEPRQRIAPEGRFDLQEHDLSDLWLTEREAQVRRQKIEEAHGEFDLGRGPLIRGRLLKRSADDHVLLVTMHHIVCDGWSMGVLVQEIAELYSAFRDGSGILLEPLPIQYADYAQWQRQSMQGEMLEKQLAYWRENLKGAPSQLELPTDRARPPVQSYRGGNVPVALDATLTAGLKAFVQRNGMTLFMVLYAGWAVMLSRLSGQDDVVIGTPIANRQRPELERLIGFFVNTLPLRVRVRGDSPVREFLDQVRDVALGAYDHQDVPFEKVVEALQPERSLSRNPLFQAALALQRAPKSEQRLPGLTISVEEGADELSMFDLSLSLEEKGSILAGSVNYASDLFDRQTVERWISYLPVILKGLIDATQVTRVAELPILPAEERRQVIELFNATSEDYPQNELAHQLFEAQVERTPDAIAATYEAQSLTYAQLNARANQLARHLRSRGIGPDRLVALCMERSLEMVVGVLGTLKAGGAYVPLDPAYPSERLAYLLEDAAPRVLLTQAALRAKMPTSAADVIALDSDWGSIANESAVDLDPTSVGLKPSDLAYVIYTSGSTGKPKGVMIHHAGLLNYLHWVLRAYAPESGDAVAVSSPLAFDATVTSLYGALLSGRTAVLVPDGKELEGLEQLLQQTTRWSLLKISPAHLNALGQRMQVLQPPCTVGAFIIGGEALPSATVQLWQSFWPEVRLINEYGPTETVVGCCIYDVPAAWAPANTVPIGRPVANTRMYILDADRQPVPLGVIGEIYIAGAGVARGYLNRDGLTAERFVADRFSAQPDARMYRSGDLARWRTDGTIECLGRNDDQVKIRGYRVEPGEIEARLVTHAHVRDAAVIARSDAPGGTQLVAYVVPREGGVTVEELRAHLQAVLPEYMIPSAFVTLDSFPLTTNGKLDRRALPSPDHSAYTSRRYQAPEGEMEELLAGIWRELLRVDRLGRDDQFFELGGHSILATQLAVRIRSALSVDVPVRLVFRFPTVRQLAAQLEELRDAHLLKNLVSGSDDIEALLERVESMSQGTVEQLIREMSNGSKS